jgi:hypothetical protein
MLPDSDALEVEHIALAGETVTVNLRACRPVADCPGCGHSSDRVHSRYTRKLTDLPWYGRRVQLHLRSRRFFCRASECPRKIFAERLPDLAEAYARTTTRLCEAHRQIGFALGGEPGSRLTCRLAMPTSPDTLLRRIRSTTLPETPVPHVLGIDDWAFRKVVATAQFFVIWNESA